MVDAVTLAIAVYGGSELRLSGFDQRYVMTHPWTHPCTTFMSAPASPLEAMEGYRKDGQRFRWVVVFLGLAVALIFFAAGVLAVTLKLPASMTREISMSWAAIDVSPGGIVVATSAGRLLVPVGGRLPNGDAVLAVDPARKAAQLSSGTLVLHAAKK
jgi:hypothetical protein